MSPLRPYRRREGPSEWITWKVIVAVFDCPGVSYKIQCRVGLGASLSSGVNSVPTPAPPAVNRATEGAELHSLRQLESWTDSAH